MSTFEPTLGGTPDKHMQQAFDIALHTDIVHESTRIMLTDPFANALIARACHHASFDAGDNLIRELKRTVISLINQFRPHNHSGATWELVRIVQDWCRTNGLDDTYINDDIQALGRTDFALRALTLKKSSGEYIWDMASRYLNNESPELWPETPIVRKYLNKNYLVY